MKDVERDEFGEDSLKPEQGSEESIRAGKKTDEQIEQERIRAALDFLEMVREELNDLENPGPDGSDDRGSGIPGDSPD